MVIVFLFVFLVVPQIQQVIKRMFPFGRGLCHAYWAPNFWVFYIILDKGLAFLLRKLGFEIQIPSASFTGGLVGDSSPFAVLPQVQKVITFLFVYLCPISWMFRSILVSLTGTMTDHTIGNICNGIACYNSVSPQGLAKTTARACC